MLRWPSLATGTDLFVNLFSRLQIEQIGTDSKHKSVLALPQVKDGVLSLVYRSTDSFRLTSRVEIPGVFPGRFPSGAWCGAHMEKSVDL
ncbi:hypothetical protein I5G94_gp033 [Mycobacterium phage Beezoo]|uniref:Uncharacterized protein n=1 Tax=Mycobacterium phage Beezoo TaxID=2250355 RepID=A0A2Z5H6U0_9CAUD|nr:hypothetical protein I5G94_gp033 [Mycobacterium phage Beezoo]AXC35815.1 hypothetical protein SEA_BEEZOO_72 [Mycobacterium phage Beezoo]QAX95737.1 hypothetical protein SEA_YOUREADOPTED_69 [Mycobacterium phage YoureAdopted]UQT01808.1 hypothetical protein SEA_POKERUS_70 [Mycobacterium phage Pokerus]